MVGDHPADEAHIRVLGLGPSHHGPVHFHHGVHVGFLSVTHALHGHTLHIPHSLLPLRHVSGSRPTLLGEGLRSGHVAMTSHGGRGALGLHLLRKGRGRQSEQGQSNKGRNHRRFHGKPLRYGSWTSRNAAEVQGGLQSFTSRAWTAWPSARVADTTTRALLPSGWASVPTSLFG